MDVGEKDPLVARDTRIGTYGAAVLFYSLGTTLIWLVLYGQHAQCLTTTEHLASGLPNDVVNICVYT